MAAASRAWRRATAISGIDGIFGAPGISDAVGIAATLRADRNDLGEKDTVPGRPASKPIPKRTFTAKPARELGDANTGESGAVPALVESHPVKPAAKSRASWGVVAVALAASMAGGFALLSEGNDEIPAPQEIAFVTADSGAGSAVNRSGTHAESDARAAEALSAQSGGVALDGGVIPNQTFAAAWDGGSVEQRGAKANDADSRAEEKAVLTVRVKPWATIVVDGKNYGQTPQTVRLKEGKHRISLENSGIGKREKFSVSLEPGQVRTIEKDWR